MSQRFDFGLYLMVGVCFKFRLVITVSCSLFLFSSFICKREQLRVLQIYSQSIVALSSLCLDFTISSFFLLLWYLLFIFSNVLFENLN